jgi:filamentous hemagglutinin family protein
LLFEKKTCFLEEAKILMIQSRRFRHWSLNLVSFSILMNVTVSIADSASGQITPDKTLGTESSIIKSNVNVRGLSADSIEGGAVREKNLFHSFLEFNVKAGQRVYFANPVQVENIISRVTGNNPSNILGTLGVSGNANLFLINPNGIIFGNSAQLDIRGSFVASTANRITFPDGNEFSASNPQAPPLLDINVPIGLQYGTQQPTAVINRGNLKVGKDLTLSGGTVTSSGQLFAPAGKVTVEGVSGNVRASDITAQTATLLAKKNLLLEESRLQTEKDLNLQARDTIQIRDSRTQPFIAAAGGKLQIQGDRKIDIFALNHPNSGLFSGRDMVLRSTNTVGGDARYFSNGNFRIEKLNKNLGNLYSPNDPIIRASGDVNFASYLGASLHILAGGSVNIPGDITITGTDNSSIQEMDVRLSNGDTIDIDGSKQPTLDIRSGTRAFDLPGITGNSDGFESAPVTNTTATSANITIGNINISQPNGLVLLTNQYQPNTNLAGDIIVTGITTNPMGIMGNGGSILLDSKGAITVRNRIDSQGFMGNGGNVMLLANDDIQVAEILSTGFSGLGGNITLNTKTSKSNIYINGEISSTSDGVSPNDKGGTIEISSGGSLLVNNAKLSTTTFGEANAGDVIIRARDTATFDRSGIESLASDGGTGNAGKIEIFTGSLSIKTNSELDSAALRSETFGRGDAGDVIIHARDSVTFDGGEIFSGTDESGTGELIEGKSGNITITTPSLRLQNNAQISARNFSSQRGDGSTITLNARSLSLDNSQISASTAGQGNAGSINVENANTVNLNNDSSISTSVDAGAVGQGGEITLNARSLSLDKSQISASTAGEGNAGSITINGNTFEAKNGGQLRTTTSSNNNAGSINLNIRDNVNLTGNNTGLFSNTDSSGKGGSISANSRNMTISDGARVTVDSRGTGEGGDINLQTDSLTLDRGTISATTDSTEGGDIFLNANNLLLLRNGSKITAQAGQTGNGGNITIDAGTIYATYQQDNDIIANASEGDGGKISITAQGLFNLDERKAISGNGTNDIDASSEFGVDGTVRIDSPNVDPSRRLVRLPNLTIAPEVLQGCRAATQQGASRFISTGRGGLPPGIDEIGDRAVWEDLRSPTPVAENPSESETVESSNSSEPTQIIEAQGLFVGSDGKIVLTAQASTVTPTQIGSSVGCRISE